MIELTNGNAGKFLVKLNIFANIIAKIGFPILVAGVLLYANFTTGKDILETLQRIETKVNLITMRSVDAMPKFERPNNGALKINLKNKSYIIEVKL